MKTDDTITPYGQSPALAVVAVSPRWRDRSKLPRRKGWYITRRKDGFVSWRAWGNGAWWNQLKCGGWTAWYNGDGEPHDFDWQPASWQSIDLDMDKLPDFSNT